MAASVPSWLKRATMTRGVLAEISRTASRAQWPSSKYARAASTSSAPTMESSLAKILAESIKASGPLTVSAFMRTCLLDPNKGYYTRTKEVLGSRGDFITSPEISQVFGELLAIFFVARWQAIEPNAPTRLIELGPGRGTLLADMIRTFSRFKGFLDQLQSIHLVEASPAMMEMQHDAISSALRQAGKRIAPADQTELAKDEIRIEWFPLVDLVPIQNDTWSMVVAHEFFDALPIHIFQRSNDGFREVLIDVDRGAGGVTTIKASDLTAPSRETAPQPRFRHVISSSPTPWSMLLAARNPRFQRLQPGQRVEVSPESWATARRIGELVSGRKGKQGVVEDEKEEDRIVREANEVERRKGSSIGGVGLVIDYGDEKAFGNSFRGFQSHAVVDPLEAPGTADLTSNVDFAYLKTAIDTTDARALPLMYQMHFLQALGLEQRVGALLKAARDAARQTDIESSAKRLVDPTGMGAQYKVFGIEAAAAATAQSGGNDNGTETTPCYPFEMQPTTEQDA